MVRMAFGVLTVTEAAKRLGVGVGRVHQFIAEGRLKAAKTGAIWLVPSEEVDRLKSIPRPTGKPPKKNLFGANPKLP
jgi:excisionase family DNA binding protein